MTIGSTGIKPTDKIKVFISSVQNKDVEDLGTERALVIHTVNHYSPTRSWAFEHTPASDLPATEYYLNGVKECQLFMLILGTSVTDAVKQEYNQAVSSNKFVFAYIKNVPRTEPAENLLQVIQKKSKYAYFKNKEDLCSLVGSSLDEFFHRLVENQLMDTGRKVKSLDINTDNINRVFLPQTGFTKKYNTEKARYEFQDITAFEYIIETLIAHSATEILLKSWVGQDEEKLLNQLPDSLKKRIKFVDKDDLTSRLTQSFMQPILEEFSMQGDPSRFLMINTKIPGKTSRAIEIMYFRFPTLLIGIRNKCQIDINYRLLQRACGTLSRECRTPEARVKISAFQSLLNCYDVEKMASLHVAQNVTATNADVFIDLLDDATFKELSAESSGIAFPAHVKQTNIKVSKLAHEITSNEKFQSLINVVSIPINAANKFPIQDLEDINLIIQPNYLPPLINLDPILKKARKTWEHQHGNKNLAERFEKSTNIRPNE